MTLETLLQYRSDAIAFGLLLALAGVSCHFWLRRHHGRGIQPQAWGLLAGLGLLGVVAPEFAGSLERWRLAFPADAGRWAAAIALNRASALDFVLLLALTAIAACGGVIVFRDEMAKRELLERERSKLQEQLTVASRKAGMAEVVTGVLHNIGNAVTNANVLAETLSDKLAHSKAPGLCKAVAMINQHKQDLSKFLSEDSRGRKLPDFLEQLSEHLMKEMSQTQADLNALRDGLVHVKQIVASQQDFARCTTVVEPINLRNLLTQTIPLVKGSMDNHGIRVTLEVSSNPVFGGDRSKLRQVLVNLLTNAKDSIRDSEPYIRKIDVELGAEPDGRPYSDGPGRGARFRIQLPLREANEQEVVR